MSSSQSYYAPDVETLPRDELAVLQLVRLKKTLSHAHTNVPHYQRSFKIAGVKPGDLQTLDDLRHFPFTVKDDLRAAYPFDMFAVPREQVLRIHASSGSTGAATVVGYTRGDLDIWDDVMARSLMTAGARPGDIFHNGLGYGLFTGGLGFHGGATRLGMTVVPMSGGNTERQVELIRDFGAQVLGATPSYALHIAEVADAQGIDLRGGSLRIGTFGAEPWTEEMRQNIEAALGIQAMDFYGLSEIIGPGVAVECTVARKGMHGWEDHFLFEVINSETGEAVATGETGELVITTLTKEALPMIRYRTRDITRLDPTPCPCGRTHVRIEKITGRNDDMLIIRGVNIFPSQIETLLINQPGLTPHYQLVVTRKNNLDVLEIEIEAEAGQSASRYAELGAPVADHIKSTTGISCTISVKKPGTVPRSSGKAVRIADLR